MESNSRSGQNTKYGNRERNHMPEQTQTNDAAIDWPGAIHATFREAGLSQIAYVPDAGHARLIELCQQDPSMRPSS